MRRPWFILFLPFYALAVWLRNRLFDLGILRATRFDTPTLIIGNLNAGGSGKTPHTEFLLRMFKDKSCAVISRGYGRKSKGFYWVNESGTADQFGDEPLQIRKKFPHIPVAVCEDRVLAVPELLGEYPDTDLILFDDAYQHRYLKGKVQILLTAWSDLFMDDFLLPAGNLREAKKEAKRADIILVSKCPEDVNVATKTAIRSRIKQFSQAPVFFTRYEAGAPVFVNPDHPAKFPEEDWKEQAVFVFSAIANESKWANPYLFLFKEKVGELCYSDHHRFTKRDIDLFLKRWNSAGKPLVITTEKDWMRLMEFHSLLQEVPLFYFPVKVHLLSDEKEFESLLRKRLF
ncbi:MAG TPA: tetraacyldisaccharide 4'-kinase [Bacteroidetes bacterium]|nr:tetraacyldisaccharide 4'-kinase [Bacteroidota bacterium]